MAYNLLDKHSGSREYVANALIAGATRAAICEGLGAKYGITAPSTRILTKWLANDYELKRMVSELRGAVANGIAGESAELTQRVDIWRVDKDFWALMHACEPFGDLVELGAVDDTATAWTEPETDYYGNVAGGASPDAADVRAEDDVLAVVTAGHETAEAFEADCVARLAARA
jgi:hypothetical protein